MADQEFFVNPSSFNSSLRLIKGPGDRKVVSNLEVAWPRRFAVSRLPFHDRQVMSSNASFLTLF
jgi:hypothetical protein